MAAIALRPATSTSAGGGSTATTTRYSHPDHLNSTNVTTDYRGVTIQTLDYYPYGSTRINQASGGVNEAKQFIAQYADPETSLSYLQARYYDGSKGEFLSEDPTFQAVGTSKLREMLDRASGSPGGFSGAGSAEQQDRQALVRFLEDPQLMNSYGYAHDNPVTKSDPTGLWWRELLTRQQSLPGFQLELGQAAGQLSKDSPAWDYAMGHPVEGGAAVGLGSGLAAYSAAGGIVVGAGFNPTLAIVGGANAYGWGQTTQSYFQWRGASSATGANQVRFDLLTNLVATAGTRSQQSALNILSAVLTVAEGILQKMSSQQQASSGSTTVRK